MRIVRGLGELRAETFRASAATWGMFDGVHRGHRGILDALGTLARNSGIPSLVLTFDPHPGAVLRGGAPPRVVRPREEERLLAEAGVDVLAILPFTLEFSMQAPQEFLDTYVVGALRAEALVLGVAAMFGRDRAGDIHMLRALATDRGIRVEAVPPLLHGGLPISSTRIRRAVAAGDLDEAGALLGRPVQIVGPVLPGAQRGRTLGFPTANVDPGPVGLPPAGVYGGRAEVDGVGYPAMANLGTRPTFEDRGSSVLEVHLLNYGRRKADDLQGKELRWEFHWRIRDEVRFPSPQALVERLEQDRRDVLDRWGSGRMVGTTRSGEST